MFNLRNPDPSVIGQALALVQQYSQRIHHIPSESIVPQNGPTQVIVVHVHGSPPVPSVAGVAPVSGKSPCPGATARTTQEAAVRFRN